MADQQETEQTEAASREEKESWKRIIDKRRSSWAALEPGVVEAFIRNPWEKEKNVPHRISKPHERLEWLLTRNFYRAVNDKITPSKRRASWFSVKRLLSAADQAVTDARKEKETAASASASAPSTAMTVSQAVPPASQVVSSQASDAKTEAVQSSTSAFSPPTSRTPSTRQRAPTPDLILPPQPSLPPLAKTWFAADIASPPLSGLLDNRQICHCEFKPKVLSSGQVKQITQRFAHFDPYWIIESLVLVMQTAEVELSSLPQFIKRALGSKVRLTQEQIKSVNGDPWGIQRGKDWKGYNDNEVRLILRMLPLDLPQEPTKAGKKARADTHLWPRGTFIQLNERGVGIQQRKQQAHDHNEFNGMCHVLDVTCSVLQPEKELKLDIGHLEDAPFVACLAVCRFQSPNRLYDMVMEDLVDKLSKKDCFQLALKAARHNTVTLDDVESDDKPPSFIFTLSCPISSSLMKTPVRAKCCKHFQCFDLRNFVEQQKHISGTRWECPVCSNELISIYDLEYCSFTASLIEQYKDEATSLNDRVEFFADGEWSLLGEPKKRYANGKKRRPSPTEMADPGVKDAKSARVQQECIEID